MTMIVAIDGLAASGKSSLAQALAIKCSLFYVDSGSFYRFITYRLICEGISADQHDAICSFLPMVRFHYRAARHFWKGRDVNEALRISAIDELVSRVARIGLVRKKINRTVRRLVRHKSAVVEGRDIGTVVFPKADLKIFLLASEEARIARRNQQRQEWGHSPERECVRINIRLRDRIDSEREIAPLVPATDAVIIDTSQLTLEETVARSCKLVEECRRTHE